MSKNLVKMASKLVFISAPPATRDAFQRLPLVVLTRFMGVGLNYFQILTLFDWGGGSWNHGSPKRENRIKLNNQRIKYFEKNVVL